ncbi:MAG: helix-turn-helix transcriptional regulator [Anaerolineae bacterium]|jgi:hypothetical protein|nr:helix-turn-helix transcriptional regulator [Anaerolineae bacterium]PKO03908.1 MAG: hypothetical protein CVU43_00035 [Chloroflexi bacterium HGW-Chloroflexi-5]
MTEQTPHPIPTKTFLANLFSAPDLESFIKNNSDVMKIPEFHAYLSHLCKSLGHIPEQIIKSSGIERTYGHQLFNGTRNPSRDKVIQLAIGLGLNVEETQRLLIIAQRNTLYPKFKRDAIILHCIKNKRNIFETQSVLQDLGLTLLSGDEKYG